MAYENVKFPCGDRNNVSLSANKEDSINEGFHNNRIMLVARHSAIKLPVIEHLCASFGELKKPIQNPTNHSSWFFVEYKTASDAEQALRYINENVNHLQIFAQFAKKRKEDDNNVSQSQRNNDQRSADTNAASPVQSSVRNLLCYGVGEATNIVTGPCTKCGRVSETQCEVCLDPYCSPSCQRLDWPAHKKICRPMPALVPAERGPTFQHPNIPKPVEKVVPFLPLPTPNIPMINRPLINMQSAAIFKPNLLPVAAPKTKPKTTQVSVHRPSPASVSLAKPTPAPVSKTSPVPAPKVATTDLPLQKEIERIAQRIKSTIVKDQPQFAPFPPSGAKVVITAAPSAGVVYVRAIDKASNLSFCQLLQDVSCYAATAKFLKEKPKRGDYVLATFEGTYYRANVLAPSSGCTDDTVKVAFIDFGNMDVVSWRQCKAIDNPELIGRTRYNFKVYLLGVDYTKHTNDATVQLINKCMDETVDFEVRYEGELPIKEKKEVTLVRLSDNVSLNAKIKELATCVSPISDAFGLSDLKIKGIPTGNNMHLMVVDASCLPTGKVTCVQKNDIENWQEVLQKVAKYCDGLSANDSYKPGKNELCLAQFEDEVQEKSWYRGVCVESVDKQLPKIRFIDFGNITEVAVADIRKIPKELVQLPLHATACRVKGLPDNVDDVLPQLESVLVAGTEILADSVEHEEELVQGVMQSCSILTINSLNL